MTVDFTHGYLPPNVYIEETSTPLAGSIGTSPSLVAFVGPSVGYQSATEQIALSSSSIRLSHQGIDTTSIVVKRVDIGATLLATTDYTATQASSPGLHDFWVDFVRVGTSAVPDGTAVWVSYHYVDPSFYLPKTFTNYEDVKASYGEPLNLTPSARGDLTYIPVTSPLSLAAKIAFENGAGSVVLLATAPITGSTAAAKSASLRTNLAAAYSAISTTYAISVVIPITDGIIDADTAGVATDLKTHVENATNDGYYRTGIVGFDPTVVGAPDTLLNSGGFRSKRLMLAYANPAGMQFWNGASNQTLALGHQYLAAALGGRLVANPVQKSLTRELIASFAGIAGTPMSNILKNQYAGAGVCITEIDRLNNLVVRHGVTTDPTTVNTRELAVVRGRDAMISLIQSGVQQAGLIGQPIDFTTPQSIKGVVTGLLEHCKIRGTIFDYAGVSIRQRSADPSVMEVKFSYKPAYPLNYIVISFAINVATGANDLALSTV